MSTTLQKLLRIRRFVAGRTTTSSGEVAPRVAPLERNTPQISILCFLTIGINIDGIQNTTVVHFKSDS